jgi:uncharacterized protein
MLCLLWLAVIRVDGVACKKADPDAQPQPAGGSETRLNRSAGATGAGRFDAFGLAARDERLAGELDVMRQARIADRLAPTNVATRVAWTIAGGHDAAGRPTLSVAIEGNLPVICQRCLQPFALPVAQQTELLLARTQAELETLDAGEAEVVLAAAPLDALTLIEDEILLSLPFAPTHAEGQCPESLGPGANAATAGQAPGATSPFARLAALKKGTDRSFEE